LSSLHSKYVHILYQHRFPFSASIGKFINVVLINANSIYIIVETGKNTWKMSLINIYLCDLFDDLNFLTKVL